MPDSGKKFIVDISVLLAAQALGIIEIKCMTISSS